MTPEEKHYWELSEVYLQAYQDVTAPSVLSMMMQGVVVEMQSDLEEFLQKDPDNYNQNKKKVDKQQNRINILKKGIDSFSVLADRNFQFKEVMRKYQKRQAELEEENAELKKQIDVLMQTIEHEK